MAADAELAAEHSGEVRAWHVRPLERTDLPQVDLLADSPSGARAQYPAYVAAWMDDTGRELDFDDDLSPALGVDVGDTVLHRGRPVVTPVRGQVTLDWAIEHVNHWSTEAYIARLDPHVRHARHPGHRHADRRDPKRHRSRPRRRPGRGTPLSFAEVEG